MKRVLVLVVGRQKDADLHGLCADYYRRCSRRFQVEERQLKDLPALGRALDALKDAVVVALDERGGQHDSRELAAMLQGWLERHASVAFVIGGADGLDDACRARADHQLALGRMTFAHRLVRLILAEQLYRAVSILEGAPYHR